MTLKIAISLRGILKMNLHEECLLKYLLNPTDLFRSTELLELNNAIIEQKTPMSNFLLSNSRKVNYTTSGI
ncbi:MAG: hypothetical protein E7Z92_01565 [Cyanobacteria bacterium SIG31]|nr:hypothetical protein [Cyanobacteria bacterium SIG31]